MYTKKKNRHYIAYGRQRNMKVLQLSFRKA